MFKCEICSRITKPREKCHKVVAETRTRYYPSGSQGWEIVREIGVCESCYEDQGEIK